MNSLYQQINQTQNNRIVNLIKNFKNSSNPKDFILNLIRNNPQMQNVYSLIQSSNQSPKQLFYKMAEQKGIDPDTILNLLK